MMTKQLAQHWWVYLVRGICALAFGLLAIGLPGLTLATLIMIFGVFVSFDGIFTCVAALSARKQHSDWWLLFIQGVFGVVLGFLSFTNPAITAIILVWYIGAWIILIGILEIIIAVRLAKQIKGEGWYILGGLLSVIIGLILIINPLPGALALTWLFGSFAVIFGIFRLISAFRARKWKNL